MTFNQYVSAAVWTILINAPYLVVAAFLLWWVVRKAMEKGFQAGIESTQKRERQPYYPEREPNQLEQARGIR